MPSTLNEAVDEAAQDQDVVIHHQRSGRYDILADNIHFPISHLQVRDLLGKVLTHLDAMGLPDRAHRAARTLLTADVVEFSYTPSHHRHTDRDRARPERAVQQPVGLAVRGCLPRVARLGR